MEKVVTQPMNERRNIAMAQDQSMTTCLRLEYLLQMFLLALAKIPMLPRQHDGRVRLVFWATIDIGVTVQLRRRNLRTNQRHQLRALY